MLRYGSVGTATTTKTEGTPEQSSERSIRRLRLTLHSGGNGKETKKSNSDTEDEKVVNGTWKKKKNGLIQRERPAGRESPEQQLGAVSNGVRETEPQRGPKVYGVVQRIGSDRQQEVMACEWSVNHLRDEMRYIREVRDSLEKVRERMYGEFGGMQQSMQKLSQEIRTANSQRRSLEAEVRVRTAALENVDQLNSSLISSHIGLQKSLLESCQTRVDKRDEMKSLRSSCEQAEEKLKDKERQLAAAEAENQTLKLQVEACQQANDQVMQDVTARLQKQHEEILREEQRKHREEIENLQAQIDEYVRRLEEAERNARIAEAKIAERDERINEVERLLGCMGQEKDLLQMKLQECEQRLRLMEQPDQTDSTDSKRSRQLEEEASELRERIKHLNDMVFCQQRKVKGMIEEVESLRTQVAQKDMFISELLDRIAIVECENNELEDKLKYFMSVQSERSDVVQTREIGVGCDLLSRAEERRFDVQPVVQSLPIQFQTRQSPSEPPSAQFQFQPRHSPSEPPSAQLQFQPRHGPSQPPSAQLQARTYKAGPPPPSRLESSLLRFSPVEYSRHLQSNPSRSCGTLTSPVPSASLSPGQPSTDQSVSAQTSDIAASSPEESTPAPSYSRATTRPSAIYTPFMRLMEITAKMNIE